MGLSPAFLQLAQRLIAANIDVAFLVQALPLDFNARRLERYLAMAWESRAQPVVVLTKIDLVDDVSPYLDQAEAVTLGPRPAHPQDPGRRRSCRRHARRT